MNSKAKGKRGELELVKYLKSWGVDARRGQQFKGGSDSPDIVHDIPGVHIECKRDERIHVGSTLLDAALVQAENDAHATRTKPHVFWRTSRERWKVSWAMLICGCATAVTASADDWMTAMGYERKT